MKKIFCSLLILPILLFCFCKTTIAQCWNNGDMTSFSMGQWGGSGSAYTLLVNNYYTVYASTGGALIVGSNFTIQFDQGEAVHSYLPQSGAAGVLNATLFDPLSSSSGSLGGNVVALKLNIDFSDAGLLSANTGLKFGDLIICGFATNTDLNGKTVRQFFDIANSALGGVSTSFTISDLDDISYNLNGSFEGGPTAFAQQHLTKGWKNGDLTTYAQPEWGADAGTTTAQSLLEANFNTVYASNFGVLAVGGGFVMTFDGASAIEDYLPQVGAAGPLDASLSDPTTSASGKFGGDVVTLQLNVDFSDAGYTGSSGLKFGDLVIYNSDVSALNGITVRNFLVELNKLLGGGTSSYGTISELQPIAFDISIAFLDGTPSAWAQLHLRRGWQNGDVKTYSQAQWGINDITAQAPMLLLDKYFTVYASAGGTMIVGLTSGFSIQFDIGEAVQDYLPQGGSPGALTATLFDPTSSAAGSFGGDVTALKLNIDFSDAGFLSGNSGLKFGDLTICGLTSNTSLNGMTVRQFLDIANTALSGGSTSYTIADLDIITNQLDGSFASGPSTFAQEHLVNGSCDCNNTVTNQCPAATAINVTTTVGTAVKFILQGSDADNNPLTYSISQNPTHGTAIIAGGDSIIYTPNTAYHGTDQLKYKVSDGSCDAEATVDITIIVCPQGSGYWKNHPDAWPVSSLLLGTTSYTKSQLITILNTPVGNGNNADASLILADQLIAAKLSLANGSPAATHLNDSIAAADALIGASLIPMKVKPNSSLGKKMISLATFFANYNNGSMTQGCRQAILTRANNENENLIEVTGGPEIKASPNPSYNNFALTIKGNNQKDQITIQVIDMYGRIIEVRNVVADSNFRFGESYRPGTYFVRIIQGKEHKEIKLIKLSD